MTNNENSVEPKGGIEINFKRVLARALQFWYFIIISLAIALTIAYLINRYSARIYPVKASILIKENEENAGAKFLYNNELLNPYRNFFNEIYIMRSYPLLQEVMEGLGFDITFYREGDIKTTEYYDPNFPVKFHILNEGKKPYGKSLLFTVNDSKQFTLQYFSEDQESKGKEFPALSFNDTLRINGFRLYVEEIGSVSEIIGKTFIVQFTDPLSLAKSYAARLKIDWAEPGASVVDLNIQGSSPMKEVKFLNRFIERYQFYDIEKKNKVATMAIRFLDEQLLVIGDSLKLYEDQVENFKKRNIITDLDEETNRLYLKLQEFENQKFQYKLLENYYSYIERLLKSEQYDGIFTPSSVGITDEVVATLVSQLIEVQIQVNVFKGVERRGAEKFKDAPVYQSKLREIQQLKNDILKTIDNSRKTQQINVAFIDDQIGIVEERLSKLPKTERELVAIQRNYSLKETLYIFLLQKRTEAGLSKASTTSDIVMVNPPMAGAAISPKVTQNYSIALVVGLAIPIIGFVFLELINNRIQSKEDIEKITRVPVIGGVGHNISKDPLIVYRKPRSAISESFRALRSNLNYFTGNQGRQVFMITSSIPGEGKSFTTLNIATVFALAGKRTVVVGADLRKPKLYDDLNLHNSLGLSQYLSGLASYEEVLQQSEIENLYLIAGGPMPPNPSELLIRPAMEKLINHLKEQFDYVIMDTPPLSYVTDAFVLSTFADHTLFVIRQNYTPRAALQSLEEFYATGKLSNISILFNDLRKSGLGYGYGGYGYGYGYGYNYGYGYGIKKNKSGEGYYEV
ncbi:MAG TPA: polysaccharide biosynthesis tyrosine autokinase [Ohtaekwangia sp.]|uniref:polysaccharide biosynthesis tyrosine autokinase n=1 Tax=Ohtaekwangia sp. TaxID=2066019 RepID=UPI002F9280CF